MKTARFAVLLALATIGPIAAEDIFRISVGRESDTSSSNLAQRVTYLERAVYQMQQRMYNLEARPIAVQPNPSTFTTCYIKTPFDGTFTSTEPTETAARANALEKCTKAGASIHCRESDVKCGR